MEFPEVRLKKIKVVGDGRTVSKTKVGRDGAQRAERTGKVLTLSYVLLTLELLKLIFFFDSFLKN